MSLSLSPLSAASPEAIAFTGVVALTIGAIGRKLWPRPAPVPAAVLGPVVPPIGAGGAVAAVPPPAIPPILPPIVTDVMCLMMVNNMFANRVGTPLLPFVGHGIVEEGQRIIATPTYDPQVAGRAPYVAAGWENAAFAMLQRMRRSVIKHGNRITNGLPHPAITWAQFAENRMVQKLFQVLAPNDARLVGRGALPLNVTRFCGFVIDVIALGRRTTNVPFPLYGYDNIRGDSAWALYYFLIVKAFLLQHGASKQQADYMACWGMIEAVGVAYGQVPGANWSQVDPGDFGFVTPATIPQY